MSEGQIGMDRMAALGEMIRQLKKQGLLVKVTGEEGEKRILRGVTGDSREVARGTLFLCKGAAFREEYLQEAVRRGCAAYVSEREWKTAGELPGLIVRDIRSAMAVVSAAFYQYRPGELILTGITGTKGKTTTAWYLKAILDEWMRMREKPETGLISTVEYYDGVSRREASLTTPEAPLLHELLSNAREAGVSHMTMEVSSQALKYKRVKGLRFQVGIFLNISEDHISPREHIDFEDYFGAKLSLFRQVETACVNLDSDHRERILKCAERVLAKDSASRLVTFGRGEEADIRWGDVRDSGGRISFRVSCSQFDERFYLAMRGSFNIENAVAAIAAATVYGVPVVCMKAALAKVKVPGRMEQFSSPDGRVLAVVDFAHNRLSFERLFDTVFQEYRDYKNIVTIFGCPGGKAYNRRRELGLLAGLYSDSVCLTSDDPGYECPEEIAREIQTYVELTGCDCTVIGDRREAVEKMVRRARESGEPTLVLLLGRGCERYQVIAGRSVEYPQDAELVREALEAVALCAACT